MLPGALTAGTPPPARLFTPPLPLFSSHLSADSSLQGSSPSWVVSGESLPFQKVSVSLSAQWGPVDSGGPQGDSAALGVGTVQLLRVQVGTVRRQGHGEAGPGSGEGLKHRTQRQAPWAGPATGSLSLPSATWPASQALTFSRCPERCLGQGKRHVCAGQLECWRSDQW